MSTIHAVKKSCTKLETDSTVLNKDLRTYFSSKLSGKGLDIGPLHQPMVRHQDMDVDYVDRFTIDKLRIHYPELNEYKFVEPDIIDDAETLRKIKKNTYDFLIASHLLEHMKNPLLALQNWVRVIKPGGKIFLVVPDKRSTFDAKRARTTIQHMILDYQSPSSERDFEHYLDLAINVHNKSQHDAIREAEHFIKLDYSIHFHVFIDDNVTELLQWFFYKYILTGANRLFS